jgi:kynurenine formamidase
VGTLVELSHPIDTGMRTYPGLPAPVIGEQLTRAASRAHYAPGTEFSVGRIEMVGNTGTYLDAPFHRFADGDDLATLALASLVELPGLLVSAPAAGERAIDGETLTRSLAARDPRGCAVLLHTGWARRWGSDAYLDDTRHPYLAREAAERLAEAGAVLIGIDSLNIDDTADGERPAHTVLLGAGIPVVEHLCGLEALPEQGFRFTAAPAAVRGMGSFPVRAYARLPTHVGDGT